MAKIQGPLLSLGAIGTFAGLLNFRVLSGQNIAQRAKTKAGPRSGNQNTESATMTAAATAWRSSDTATRFDWSTLADQRGLPPFAYFFKAWKLQDLPHVSWDPSTILPNADPPQSTDGTPLYFPLEPAELVPPTTPLTGTSRVSRFTSRPALLRLAQATPGAAQ
jgi:hypothetical protein